MPHEFIADGSFNAGTVKQYIEGVPAVVGRMPCSDTAGEQGAVKVFPVARIGYAVRCCVVYEARELPVIPAAYHVIDGGMDRDSPVTAVAVFQPAREGAPYKVDIIKRHACKLVNPETGVAVYQDGIYKWDFPVRP